MLSDLKAQGDSPRGWAGNPFSWELPPYPGIMVPGGHQQILAKPSESLNGS